MPFAKKLRTYGIEFCDPTLLQLALTHRSVGSDNNERLEYLGDAALGLVIAEALFTRMPEADEGLLSRFRSNLVCGDSLAEIGKKLGIGAELHLGEGELKTGGRRRASILADAVEAVLGAVLLDSGFARTKTLILEIFADRLQNLPAAETLKDPKTRLQEWLQGRGADLPFYRLLKSEGADHQRSFVVECQVNEKQQFIGRGSSRRKAEQSAAQHALGTLAPETKSR